MCPTSGHGENLELCVETHMTVVICTMYVPVRESRTILLDRAGQKRPPGTYWVDQALGIATVAAGEGQLQTGEPMLKSSGSSEADLNYNPSPATCYL